MAVINQFNQMNQGQSGIGMGQSQQKKKPVGSGQFTNINRMIQSNVGAGQQYAQKLSESAQKQSQQTAQNIAQTTGQFTGQQGAIQKEQKNIQDTSAQIQKAVQDQSAKNLLDNQAVTNVLTGANQGQQFAQQFGEASRRISGNIGQIGATGEALQTEAGRGMLLRNKLARPGYGGGMAALDQSLLQTEGSKDLANLQSQTLSDYLKKQEQLSGLGKSVEGELAGLSQASELERAKLVGDDKTGGLLQESVAKLKSQKEAEAEEFNKRMEEEYQTALKALQDPKNLTPELREKLGLTKGTRIYNVLDRAKGSGFQDYLTKGTTTWQNLIGSNEFENYQALDKFLQTAGKGDAGLGLVAAGDKENLKSVGYNKEAIATDIKAAEDKFFKNLAQEQFIGTGSHSYGVGGWGPTKRYNVSRDRAIKGSELVDQIKKDGSTKGTAKAPGVDTFGDRGDIGNFFKTLIEAPGANASVRKNREKEAVRIAENQARARAQASLNKWLEQSGYNRTV